MSDHINVELTPADGVTVEASYELWTDDRSASENWLLTNTFKNFQYYRALMNGVAGESYFFLHKLKVVPKDKRGQGFGAKALQVLEHHAARHGAKIGVLRAGSIEQIQGCGKKYTQSIKDWYIKRGWCPLDPCRQSSPPILYRSLEGSLDIDASVRIIYKNSRPESVNSFDYS